MLDAKKKRRAKTQKYKNARNEVQFAKKDTRKNKVECKTFIVQILFSSYMDITPFMVLGACFCLRSLMKFSFKQI